MITLIHGFKERIRSIIYFCLFTSYTCTLFLRETVLDVMYLYQIAFFC